MVPNKLGLKISLIDEHIHPLTRSLCSYLGNINPMRLISSGTLIILVDSPIEAFKLLKLSHKVSKIGEITRERKFLLDDIEFGPPQPDELIKALKDLNNKDKQSKLINLT